MRIIRDRAIVDDTTPFVTLAEYVKDPAAHLAAHVGVRVPPDKLPEDIPELARLAVIALEFPKYGEGRPFSVARLLRDRFHFTGELRAVGYVIRDQLRYLERVGFNAFELKEGASLESALEAFAELGPTYQADANQPLPIYRRR